MSAWAALVHADGSDEWLELCNAALQEVQREQSRRNATLIRNHPGPHLDEQHPGASGFWWDTRDRDAAANLIDPDKET